MRWRREGERARIREKQKEKFHLRSARTWDNSSGFPSIYRLADSGYSRVLSIQLKSYSEASLYSHEYQKILLWMNK